MAHAILMVYLMVCKEGTFKRCTSKALYFSKARGDASLTRPARCRTHISICRPIRGYPILLGAHFNAGAIHRFVTVSSTQGT